MVHARRVSFCFCVVVMVCDSVAWCGPDYSFAPINTNYNTSSYRINNNGDMSFGITLQGKGYGTGFNTPTLIIGYSSINFFTPPADINDANTIVFSADLTGASRGNGLYRGGKGLTLTRLVSPAGVTGTWNSIGITPPSINTGGSVAFDTLRWAAGGNPAVHALHRYDAGVITKIAQSDDPFWQITSAPLGAFDEMFLADNGNVAFRAPLVNGADNGLFMGNGGAIQTIEDTRTGDLDYVWRMVMNHNGRMFYSADTDTGHKGLYLWNNSVRQTLVDDTGIFSGFSTLGIADTGEVVFKANLDAGGAAIYTGGTHSLTRVIGIGDAFGDTSVTDCGLDNQCIINSGDVVLWVELADGTATYLKASPVPEPGSAAVLLVGATMMLCRRCRRARSE